MCSLRVRDSVQLLGMIPFWAAHGPLAHQSTGVMAIAWLEEPWFEVRHDSIPGSVLCGSCELGQGRSPPQPCLHFVYMGNMAQSQSH
jgi:hypothetical protein